MVLLKLFLTFFRIGSFAIGGAYSFLPLLEREIVQKYNWLTKEEFLDILGMSNIFPGAISNKYATYTGYKLAGIFGAVAANLGVILTPILLVLCVFGLYLKYKDVPVIQRVLKMVELSVFAMIVAVAFRLIKFNDFFQSKNLLVILASFALFFYTKIHPAVIVICAGILGVILK